MEKNPTFYLYTFYGYRNVSIIAFYPHKLHKGLLFINSFNLYYSEANRKIGIERCVAM